jgi:nucleotide-binding universal stress UspA family protein
MALAGCAAEYPLARKELAMLPIRTILHPTDFSGSAQYAFRLACSLARDHGARLVVLHAAPECVPVPGGAGQAEIAAEHQKRLRRKLEQVTPPDATLRVDHLLECGDPADVICRVSREAGFDLVVMGTHGRTGLHRLLMGSVAEKVVRRAACPVLVVKPPLPDDAHDRLVDRSDPPHTR